MDNLNYPLIRKKRSKTCMYIVIYLSCILVGCQASRPTNYWSDDYLRFPPLITFFPFPFYQSCTTFEEIK